MRAIKIDVVKRECYYVDYQTIDDMQALIGCSCFCSSNVPFPGGDMLYVDDEGLLKEHLNGFKVFMIDYVFLGNGLICGHDKEGESRDVQMPLEYITPFIHFGIRGFE